MNTSDPVLSSGFVLVRDAFGRLVLTNTLGERILGVVPVRAFPIQSPHGGIALVDVAGREVAWFDRLEELPEPVKALIGTELAQREFMPILQKVKSVSGYSTPCIWTVSTDRGDTEFVLRADEDIRRIGATGALLISDTYGIQFLIPDHKVLDVQSRKILDRFL